MNLGRNFSGFLGRSLSAPCKLISESIAFAKKSISGGLGGMIGGGKFRVGIEEDDEIWNGSGRILGYPLIIARLTKMTEY